LEQYGAGHAAGRFWKTWTSHPAASSGCPRHPGHFSRFSGAGSNGQEFRAHQRCESLCVVLAAFLRDSLARYGESEIFQNHFDGNLLALLVCTLLTVAQHDHHRLLGYQMRISNCGSHGGSTIVPAFALPQHPGFPSGHACASGAASAVLSYLFPSDAQSFAAMAQDAGNSTFYAQIHSMFDVAQGLAQGGQVGQAVVKYAQSDGAR
jgi:membrane-associated phospholipid phosphatase